MSWARRLAGGQQKGTWNVFGVYGLVEVNAGVPNQQEDAQHKDLRSNSHGEGK